LREYDDRDREELRRLGVTPILSLAGDMVDEDDLRLYRTLVRDGWAEGLSIEDVASRLKQNAFLPNELKREALVILAAGSESEVVGALGTLADESPSVAAILGANRPKSD
jgi:hypothetical protein